jgi:leucyl/phenylalanyl-tRNA--protein transferase
MMQELTPELIVSAYAQGAFPMADSHNSKHIRWFSPDPRAILPLDTFHVPRRLKRVMTQNRFEFRRDSDFENVIRLCAQTPRTHEKGTWINQDIIEAYVALHKLGQAHSVESWQNDKLVGGLYGVSLGGAFFGESMFSLVPNASKAALVALVEHLRAQGFQLLDTQFINPHLIQFGVQEIPRDIYLSRLKSAISSHCHF